jgi:hypothetical protein
MSNKYLIIEFKNASLFPKEDRKDSFLRNFPTKDKSFLPGKWKTKDVFKIDRECIPYFKEYITINHISNMIHVLFGERPVPTNRVSIYNKLDYYFDMAANSYLKINEDAPFIETIQSKKLTHDSYNPNHYINWLVIKDYLGSDLYNDFIEILQTNGFDKNQPLDYILDDIRKLFSNNEFTEFIDNIKLNGKSALLSYIIGRADKDGIMKPSKDFSKSTNTRLCVTTAISNCIKLSGEIIIPLNENDIERLRKSKGCATILDGGLVKIKNMILEDDFSEDLMLMDGFRIVKDISLETY